MARADLIPATGRQKTSLSDCFAQSDARKLFMMLREQLDILANCLAITGKQRTRMVYTASVTQYQAALIALRLPGNLRIDLGG